MYCGETARWDHFPKNLRIGEFLDPLQVVLEFFSTGLPLLQLKNLEEWRYFVVEEKYYNDLQLGPERLLLIYDLQLRLIKQRGEQFSNMYLHDLDFSFRHLTSLTEQDGSTKHRRLNQSYLLSDNPIILLNEMIH